MLPQRLASPCVPVPCKRENERKKMPCVTVPCKRETNASVLCQEVSDLCALTVLGLCCGCRCSAHCATNCSHFLHQRRSQNLQPILLVILAMCADNDGFHAVSERADHGVFYVRSMHADGGVRHVICVYVVCVHVYMCVCHVICVWCTSLYVMSCHDNVRRPW